MDNQLLTRITTQKPSQAVDSCLVHIWSHVAVHTPAAFHSGLALLAQGVYISTPSYLLNLGGFDHCSPLFLMTFQAVVLLIPYIETGTHILYAFQVSFSFPKIVCFLPCTLDLEL